MIIGLLPLILQGFAMSVGGVAGDIAARSVWEKISKDPEQAKQLPAVFTRWLQASLRIVGHVIDVDGHFGPKTETEVKAFQASHNLVIDGIAGPQTLAALANAVTAAKAPDTEGY